MSARVTRGSACGWAIVLAWSSVVAGASIPFAYAQPPEGPAGARNIELCHGAIGSVCDTGPAARPLDAEHLLSARVHDAEGGPVAGVPVEFRETGPAQFTPQGGNSVVVTTGDDGVAQAVITSPQFGTTAVVAEISPPGTSGGFRGSASDDDECEQPPGSGGVPPAGNCISTELTVTWEDQHEFPECDDDLDNDGDYLVDEQDPGCADDNSEGPFNGGSEVAWDRTVGMRFAHVKRPGGRLVIFGKVGVVGAQVPPCIADVVVAIQRRVDGEWRLMRSTVTNERGQYFLTLNDAEARYRAIARRHRARTDDGSLIGVCRNAYKAKPHRH